MEPVTFGKKRALLVKDSNRRMLILNSLRKYSSIRLWERSTSKLKNTDSISKEILNNIKIVPHLTRYIPVIKYNNGTQSDAPEYFLFLTSLGGHVSKGTRRICCLIEKKHPLDNSKIYQTRFRFRDNLFDGTLFSGYFLSTEEGRTPERIEVTEGFSSFFPKIKREVSAPQQLKKWIFLINDLWVHKGKDISLPLTQRLVTTQDIFGFHHYPDPRLDICEFSLTRYLDYDNIENFLRNERKYYYYDISDCKVIFISTNGVPGIEEFRVSLNNPLEDNKKLNTVERKSLDGKSEVMKLEKSEYPDVYWVIHPDNNKNYGAARVRSLEESEKLRDLFIEVENHDKNYLLLNCVYEEEFSKWRPLVNKLT
jgi:hypothetical protein